MRRRQCCVPSTKHSVLNTVQQMVAILQTIRVLAQNHIYLHLKYLKFILTVSPKQHQEEGKLRSTSGGCKQCLRSKIRCREKSIPSCSIFISVKKGLYLSLFRVIAPVICLQCLKYLEGLPDSILSGPGHSIREHPAAGSARCAISFDKGLSGVRDRRVSSNSLAAGSDFPPCQPEQSSKLSLLGGFKCSQNKLGPGQPTT